ncbi:hypothetical protein AGMMS50268_27110 [Spirochaetia bacterium]|nr:hypothetical protein AGMMS50268_27110 [Spirochaetia bacterium]
MKKKFLLIGFLVFVSTAFVTAGDSAADLENRIEAAVAELAAAAGAPVTVAVYPILLIDSETTSALSRYLHGKIAYFVNKSGKLLLSSSTIISSRNIEQGSIEGVYAELGNVIDVTLSLFSASNKNIGTANFKITKPELEDLHIEWLPENRVTQTAVQLQDKQIDALLVEAAVPAVPAKTFNLDAWPNSESYTYVDGEKMQINLRSDKDCYFKVYYVDAENNMQLIYPNATTGNNFLRANTIRTIPDTTEYVMEAPFGVESILVIASDARLPYTTGEMMPVQGVRGMSQVLKNAANTASAPGAIIVEKRFNYTVVPKNIVEEVLSYPKPDNMNEFVQAIQNTLKSEGGTFTGNEQAGTFSVGAFKGSYRIQGASLTVSLQHPIEESIGWGVSKTRSMSNVFNFSFGKPENIQAAVETVRNGISSKGGLFSGNTQKGEFKASGITGKYEVADNVRVSIIEKPFILTNNLIEKEVKKFFGVK